MVVHFVCNDVLRVTLLSSLKNLVFGMLTHGLTLVISAWPNGPNALTQNATNELNVLYARAGGVKELPLLCRQQSSAILKGRGPLYGGGDL